MVCQQTKVPQFIFCTLYIALYLIQTFLYVKQIFLYFDIPGDIISKDFDDI